MGNLKGPIERSWNWRRRPDLNRGWRFCRPLPYLLATAPRKMTRGPKRPALRPQRRQFGAWQPWLGCQVEPRGAGDRWCQAVARDPHWPAFAMATAGNLRVRER